MPAPQNPFYANSNSKANPPPPAYKPIASPPPSGGPVSYGSLSDLTSGKARPVPPPPPPRQEVRYTPIAERSDVVGGRRVPPVPVGGMAHPAPPEPPRRGAAPPIAQAPPVPPRQNNSYIPEAASPYITSAGQYASSAGERMKDGFDTVMNQQRKEQVMTGVGKVVGGAFKLGGKAVYQVGKFATK